MENALHFQIYGVQIEIAGPSAKALASPFEFYTDRPQPLHRAPFGKLSLEQAEARGWARLGRLRKGTESSGRLQGSGRKAEMLGQSFLDRELKRLLARRHLHALPALGLGFGKDAALVFLGKGLDISDFAYACLERGGLVYLGNPLLGPLSQILPFPKPLRLSGSKVALLPSKLPSQWLPHPEEVFRPRHLIWAERGPSNAALTSLAKWQAAAKLSLALRPRRLFDLLDPGATGQLSRTAASSLMLALCDTHRLRCSSSAQENADVLVEALRVMAGGKPTALRLG